MNICPYCGDTRLSFNPRPTGRHDEGDLFHCAGCGREGESVNLVECNHPGGFRADTGEWECSRCGKRFPSYEAWGEATGNYEAVAAVKMAIVADLAEMTNSSQTEES